MEKTEIGTLADLRRAAGKTQAQVAEVMGVTRPRVSQIEADYPNVHFLVLRAYVQALGGSIRATVAGVSVEIDQVESDPERVEAGRRRRERARTGGAPFVANVGIL